MCVGVLDDQSRDALWFTHGDTQGHGRAAVVHVHEAITDVEMNEQFVNGGGVTVERGMRQHVGATLPGQIRSDDVGNLCEWADHVAERVGRAREPVDQEHRRSARITSCKVGQLGAFGQRERRRTGAGCIDLTSLAVATSEPTPRPRSPHILRRSERCRTGSLPIGQHHPTTPIAVAAIGDLDSAKSEHRSISSLGSAQRECDRRAQRER